MGLYEEHYFIYEQTPISPSYLQKLEKSSSTANYSKTNRKMHRKVGWCTDREPKRFAKSYEQSGTMFQKQYLIPLTYSESSKVPQVKLSIGDKTSLDFTPDYSTLLIAEKVIK
jgi:hypothetical protein